MLLNDETNVQVLSTEKEEMDEEENEEDEEERSFEENVTGGDKTSRENNDPVLSLLQLTRIDVDYASGDGLKIE